MEKNVLIRDDDFSDFPLFIFGILYEIRPLGISIKYIRSWSLIIMELYRNGI